MRLKSARGAEVLVTDRELGFAGNRAVRPIASVAGTTNARVAVENVCGTRRGRARCGGFQAFVVREDASSDAGISASIVSLRIDLRAIWTYSVP